MPTVRASPSAAGEGDVDHAALLGAVVAAVLSLTLTDGQWSSLNTCIGALLLAIVLGFAPPTRPAGESSRLIGWLARCGVVGTCLALTAAWPLQRLLVELDDVCLFRSDSVDAYDTCVRREASSWLWLVVAVATVGCALVTARSYWASVDRPARPDASGRDSWAPPS
jgi:hypothetical protein